MLKKNLFDEISNAINLGNHKGAIKILAKLSKMRGLTPYDKHQLARAYHRVKETAKALRLVGRELSQQELREVTDDELYLQGTFANLLGYLGASYVSRRLFQYLDQEIENRSLNDFMNSFPEYLRYKAYHHLRSYDYKSALPFFQEYSKRLDPKTHTYGMIQIGEADSMAGMGEYERAILIVSKVIEASPKDDVLLLGIAYQAKGEYLFKAEKYDLAFEALEKAFPYFNEDMRQKRDFAYLLQWSAAVDLENKKYESAKQKLLEAIEVLHREKFQPLAIIEVLYWLSKVPDYPLSLGHAIALKAHNAYTPHSLLAGRQRTLHRNIPLSPWVEKRLEPVVEDTWLIQNGEIKAVTYKEIISQVWNKDISSPLLDLKSRVYRYNEKKMMTLSDIQNNCLACVVGAGSLGVSNWSLIDFIYRQEFFNVKSGEERLKKLINDLKKKKFPILRDKNYYFFDLPENMTVLLPMDLSSVGPMLLISHLFSSFSRRQVEDFFKVHKSSAIRWLKEGLESGLLQKSEKDGEITYSK